MHRIYLTPDKSKYKDFPANMSADEINKQLQTIQQPNQSMPSKIQMIQEDLRKQGYPTSMFGVESGEIPGGWKEAEMAPSTLFSMAMFANPQFSAIRYANSIANAAEKLANPLLNLATRLGTSTGTSTGMEYFLPDNEKSLSQIAKGNLGASAIFEAATMPFRGIGFLAEQINRAKYALQKSKQIHQGIKESEKEVERLYDPVNTKYGKENIIPTSSKEGYYSLDANRKPEEYLSNLGINKDELFSFAQKKYDAFLKNPTYENLNNLQSQIGKDWSKISILPNNEKQAQSFFTMRESIKNAMKDFLSHDPKTLEQFEKANEYASNVYYPYLATSNLKKIGQGKMDIDAKTLAKSLKTASEKKVGTGYQERSVVPEGHPLRQISSEMQGKINRSQLYQYLIPAIANATIGQVLHPGILGAGLGGLTGAALGHAGSPIAAKVLQNPSLMKMMENLSKVYYPGTRAITATSGNK